MNKIQIKQIFKNNNRLSYNYDVTGEWEQYFNEQEFYIEYETNIEDVPDNILVIPLICNILPVAWLCNAKIELDELDEDFYNGINLIKQGYKDMYPEYEFKGEIKCTPIRNIPNQNIYKAATFFSGGVDAYHTLFSNIEEKPLLLSIWGSDIKCSNKDGWSVVESHLRKASTDFKLDLHIIKSSFRDATNYKSLNKLMIVKNHEWWHEMQHGISLISHAAPLAYIYGINTCYIASSYTYNQKGEYTCASDPTIDNFVSFSGAKTIHHGYDFERNEKIKMICETMYRSHSYISDYMLRVCWRTTDGENCCVCEKCCRTILCIISQGFDPNKFGFKVTKNSLKYMKKLYCEKLVVADSIKPLYQIISKNIRENKQRNDNYSVVEWVTELNWCTINDKPYKILSRFILKVKKKIKSVIKKIIVK